MPAERTATVTRLGGTGDGVVETPQGIVYVPGALPGETVILPPETAADDDGHGTPATIVGAASLDRRATPLCSHVARCGGCSLQHMSDDLYRRWKPTLLEAALRQHGIASTVEPMLAIPPRTRRRAVLTATRAGNTAAIGFHARRTHRLEPIVDCAVLHPAIVAALPGISEIAREVLPSAGESHVTVIATAAGPDVAFETGRKSFAAADAEHVLQLAARHRIARLTVAAAPLGLRAAPTLSIAGIAVSPPPAAFLQAACEAETVLQELVVAGVGKARQVADLFSGLGTFALALASKARVLAIDGERPLIEALAEAHRRAQGLKPVTTRVRDLYLDPLSPRELDGFDAVVFDPPRAGAKTQAEAIARSKVKTVVAVSCNPATLARDLRILIDSGYRLARVTPVDQFLFTPHLEAVAVLRR